jgi:hypothetical protein
MSRRLLASAVAALLIAQAVSSPAHGQSHAPGGPIAGDGSTQNVRVNPGGTAPNGTVAVTYDPRSDTGVGPAMGGTIQIGTAQGGNGSGGNGGGGGGAGGPVGCVPTGVIVTGTIELPGFGIATSPPREGVVGLPSWFWSDNYAGAQVPRRTVSGYYIECVPEQVPGAPFGVTQLVSHVVSLILYVDLWPTHYEWRFGDGHRESGTCAANVSNPVNCTPDALGRENNAQIQNVYENSSARFADGYPVELSVTFEGRIGSPGHWTPFGPFDQQASMNYPVREIQSVLVE